MTKEFSLCERVASARIVPCGLSITVSMLSGVSCGANVFVDASLNPDQARPGGAVGSLVLIPFPWPAQDAARVALQVARDMSGDHHVGLEAGSGSSCEVDRKAWD